MADTTIFVDVAYHGLEVGSRLKLSEFGPTTAYLEHAAPLPVGTDLVLQTDDGRTIEAAVVRVQEQVSGADHNPGMRVRAQLSGELEGWWSERVTCEDPVIPEPYVAPSPVPPEQHPVASDTEVAATMPVEPPSKQDESERETAVMDAVTQEALREESKPNAIPEGAGEQPGEQPDQAEAPTSRKATTIMSAQELAEITKHADGEDSSDKDGGNSKPKKKKRRRSRKKRTE